MSSSQLGAFLLCVATALFLDATSWAQTPASSAPVPASSATPPPGPSPEGQIKRILSRQEIAWNVGDSAGWGSAFAEDADFINILGQAFHGRETITQVLATRSSSFKGSHTTVTLRQFRQVTPDVALVETLQEVTHLKVWDPGIVPTEGDVLKTRMRYVFLRRDDVWQIVSAQNTAIHPVAAGTVK